MLFNANQNSLSRSRGSVVWLPKNGCKGDWRLKGMPDGPACMQVSILSASHNTDIYRYFIYTKTQRACKSVFNERKLKKTNQNSLSRSRGSVVWLPKNGCKGDWRLKGMPDGPACMQVSILSASHNTDIYRYFIYTKTQRACKSVFNERKLKKTSLFKRVQWNVCSRWCMKHKFKTSFT